jgi:hypothetical protein
VQGIKPQIGGIMLRKRPNRVQMSKMRSVYDGITMA